MCEDSQLLIGVVDASVFMNIHSLKNLSSQFSQIFISEQCNKEIKSFLSQSVLSLLNGKLTVLSPTKRSLNETTATANQMGEHSLSSADLSAIALALDFRVGNPVLISDDFAVQNVAKKLNIRTRGSKVRKNIKLRHYSYTCMACGSNNGSNNVECDVCGFTRFRKQF